MGRRARDSLFRAYFKNISRRAANHHFLDNAKYFKAKVVREWLETHKEIQLEFLPSYSPNLNLVERFWRFAKEELVKNTYYAKYKTFRAKVFRSLNNISDCKGELKSLMIEKFQIVKT